MKHDKSLAGLCLDKQLTVSVVVSAIAIFRMVGILMLSLLHFVHCTNYKVRPFANSNRDTGFLATRYNSCQVKVWDRQELDTWTLQPSTTALVLDEAQDAGLVSNYVSTIGLNDHLIAAGYNQGKDKYFTRQASLSNSDLWFHGNLDKLKYDIVV